MSRPFGDVSRRDWLRRSGLGLSALAAGVPGSKGRAFADSAGAPPSLPVKAKSVIVLFYSGGLPQHETWDPKPDAPAEVRGAFGSIETRTPGLRVGELMPQTARLADKLAVIRTMVTGDASHSTSGYQMLTGVPHIPLSRENSLPGRPNDAPSLMALVQALRPSRGGLPSSIVMPRRLANFGGLYPWPGSDAGTLGRKFDPWLIECDPNDPKFAAPGCELPEGLAASRVGERLDLLKALERPLDGGPSTAEYELHKQQSIDLIAGGRSGAAFDLAKEPVAVRERYGRTKQGQCVLLARRLVEAGVSLVQVNWASPNKDFPNSGGWDTHEKHNESLKGWLMPIMDQSYSALIEDLDARGLLDETLVCFVAEFGHTPKFNKRAGRDHWGKVFSIALAGAGIRGGVVHGTSDPHAAEPTGDVVRPCDYIATVLHQMGYAPDTLVHDQQGRPQPITRGRVLHEVLA